MNKEKIINLLVEELEIPYSELSEHKGYLTDIGLTSLKFISFIVKLEQEFDIEILDSDLLLDKFTTLENLFDTLKKYFAPSSSMKKCLILDADGVLWKGVSGEDDILIDSDVLKFQTLLEDLYQKGVMLCVCSKNEEFLINDSFNDPDMLLTKEHLVYTVANRQDKVTNIKSIVKALNISFDAVVFVDDSDYELGFVSANLPEIECIKFDYSDMSVIKTISEFFSKIAPTTSLNRTQLYIEQKEREKDKLKYTSIDEYNKSLLTEVTIERADEKCIERLSELSIRTHQFNLSAKSYTAEDLHNMLTNDTYSIFTLRVRDKYGDMGIIGMAILKEDLIEAFMISCRAFDRGLETLLLEKLKSTTLKTLQGVYTPTNKNKRFAEFYAENGVIQI